MPRLPTAGYQQQIGTPSNTPRTDVYQAPGLVDTSQGLRSAAAALGDLSQQLKAEQEQTRQTEERAIITEAVQRERLNFTRGFEEDATTPGEIEARTKKREEEARARAKALKLSTAGSNVLNERLGELGAEFGVRAIQYSTQESRRRSEASFTASLEAGKSTVLADGRQYEAVARDLKDGLALLHGKLLPEQEEQLRTSLQNVAATAVLGEIQRDPVFARKYLGERLGIAPGSDVSGGIAPSVSEGDASLFGAIVQVESNGKHLGADGQLLRGPATAASERAVGKAQLLPGTAKEAAGAAGIEWDPIRFIKEPAYYDRIARAHLDKLTRRFSGNVSAIAAAYNMGEGAAAAWVTGKPYQTVSGKQWTPSGPMDPKAMPKETRDYIGKVYANLNVTPANAAPMPDLLPTTATNPAGGPFRDITAAQAVQLFSTADAEVRQREALARQHDDIGKATFAQQNDDLRATLKAGEYAPLPEPSKYAWAYGEEKGLIQRRQDEVLQSMAADFAGLKTAKPAEITTILAKHKPTGTEDREARAFAYGVIQQEADRVTTQRAADPIRFAIADGLYGVQPIDVSNPGLQWISRDRAAQQMRKDFGTPYRLLSNDEATAYSGALANSTAAEKLKLLSQTHDAVTGPGFQSIMGQVAGDQPLTAAAGSLLAVADATVAVDGGTLSGAKVASTILAGAELLSPPKGGTKVELAADSTLRAQFSEAVGEAYAGHGQAFEQSFQAFRAYYTARAAAKGTLGNKLADPALVSESVTAVTGGIGEINDKPLVLPWGVSEYAFQRQAEDVWPRVREMAGLPESMPFERVTFSPAGGDRYYVMAGETPILSTRSSSPILITIGRKGAAVGGDLNESMGTGYGF